MSVRRFCGLVLGSLQCSDANVVFRVCCCFASQSRPCDVIPKDEAAYYQQISFTISILPSSTSIFEGVLDQQILANNPQCMYHFSCEIDFYVCLVVLYII